MSTFAYCPNCPTEIFPPGLPGNSSPSKETNRFKRAVLEKLLGIATKAFFGKDLVALKKLEGLFEEAFEQFDEGQEISLERATFQNAFMFLLMLPNDIALPELEIEENGDITMEWYRDKWNLFTVIMDESDVYYYAGLFGSKDNRDKGRKPLSEGVDEIVLRSIRRIQG